MSKNFNVTLETYTDDEGVEYVIPSATEIQELEDIVSEEEQEAEFMMKADDEQQAIAKIKIVACRRTRQDIERKKKTREHYSKLSQKVSYTLKEPTYGAFLDAELASKTLDPNGVQVLDDTKMMYELLSACVDKSAPRELSPTVARILYAKLRKRAYPDPTRLPFL